MSEQNVSYDNKGINKRLLPINIQTPNLIHVIVDNLSIR